MIRHDSLYLHQRCECNFEVQKMCLNIFYLCNFNDEIRGKGENIIKKKKEIVLLHFHIELENECLERLWRCEWSPVYLEQSLQQWWEISYRSSALTEEEIDRLLLQAIELLLIFTQNNFTGPFDQLEEFKKFVKNANFLDINAGTELKENGEELNPNVNIPELLFIARRILQKLLENSKDSMVRITIIVSLVITLYNYLYHP